MLSRRRGEAWAAPESDYSQSPPKGHCRPLAPVQKSCGKGDVKQPCERKDHDLASKLRRLCRQPPSTRASWGGIKLGLSEVRPVRTNREKVPASVRCVSGEMKLGYFWRFEIPGAIARLLPGNHEKPSSFFIFLLKEVRTRCGVAQERFRKAPQAKDVKNFREFQIARFTPFSRRRSQ